MPLSLSRVSLLFFILIVSSGGYPQSFSSDLELIKKSVDPHDKAFHKHNPTFLLSEHPSAFVRYNPATLLFGGMMWVYQKVVSPQFSSTCLYHPSCSAYSMYLISDYGLIPGIIFTTDRLMRCNRLSLLDFNSWEADPDTGKIKESTSFYRLNE